jgi:D-sedoheptulose 7-phosphate isomerase
MTTFPQSRIQSIIQESIATKERVIAECLPTIHKTGLLLAETLQKGGKILFCGNGGSAADAQHIAAELVVRFRGSVQRRSLPAIALTVDSSILTAGANDFGYDAVFARAVEGYGQEGDVLVGITTSGNSPSIINAFKQAKSQTIATVGLLGCGGGKILPFADASVIVPSSETARIQESHILIGHIWCEMIEELLFPELFEKH